MVNWNPERKIPEFRKIGMERLVASAEVVRMNAIYKLQSLITGMTTICRKSGDTKEPWKEHEAYKKGAAVGKYWTARHYRAMVHTIRVVRKYNETSRDVRIYAGNKKTWWALQMEYGRGGWKGGAKPFLRPAIRSSIAQIKVIIESGAGQTKDSGYYNE